MDDIVIGKGDHDGKGTYANRDFKKGEVVIAYHLTPLTESEWVALSESEKSYTHTYHGRRFLYGEPERYVHHADHPNTRQDHDRKVDVALRDIKKGELITCDARKDDIE